MRYNIGIGYGKKCGVVIVSYRDKATQMFANGESIGKFRAFERVAYRKLKYLMAAMSLEDLRIPPGNRLEALQGDRGGEHSIRINDQWRICFTWTEGGAADVEIVDYH